MAAAAPMKPARAARPAGETFGEDGRGRTRHLAGARTALALVVGIVTVSVVLHVVWLVRFRHGYVTEWDESGYMQFSLSNYDALREQGAWTFAKTVAGRGGYGPLLPFVTSLAYPFFGRGVFGGLLVLPLFFVGLVAATFALARQLVSNGWAVIAALVVAATPAVIDYARLFHFALPAAACMTAALWALLRSDGLRRPGWSAAFGLFVALTLLARTMTVAFLPAFVLAAAALFLVGGAELRLRLRNLAIAAGTALLVAGPWYIRNARSIFDNLLGPDTARAPCSTAPATRSSRGSTGRRSSASISCIWAFRSRPLSSFPSWSRSRFSSLAGRDCPDVFREAHVRWASWRSRWSCSRATWH